MKETGKLMAGFAVLGCLDVVGVAKNYIQDQFMLSSAVSGFIPLACYLWFLFLSIPFAGAAARWGRRNVTTLGFLLCSASLCLPFIFRNSLAATLVAVTLLGISSTAVMVAFNPFVQDVVGAENLSRTLLFGQGTKSLIAVAIPMLLPFFASTSLGWQGSLVLLGMTGLAGAILLHGMKVEEKTGASVNLESILKLLGKREMLLCFIAAVIIVAVDVGVMATFPRIIQARTGACLDGSTFLTVAYPLSKTAIAFCGGMILKRIGEKRYLCFSTAIAFAGLVGLAFLPTRGLLTTSLIVFGAGYTNLFSIVLSNALRAFPDNPDAVSSLMIMSLCGGGLALPILNLFL